MLYISVLLAVWFVVWLFFTVNKYRDQREFYSMIAQWLYEEVEDSEQENDT